MECLCYTSLSFHLIFFNRQNNCRLIIKNNACNRLVWRKNSQMTQMCRCLTNLHAGGPVEALVALVNVLFRGLVVKLTNVFGQILLRY